MLENVTEVNEAIHYDSDGMSKKEFKSRFGDGAINLSPIEKPVEHEYGYLISISEIPTTVELSQLLNVLEDYSPDFVKKHNIYLKIEGMGAYEITQAKLDIVKYTRLKGIFQTRGIKFYKVDINSPESEDTKVELNQRDLMHTVKFRYDNDATNFI